MKGLLFLLAFASLLVAGCSTGTNAEAQIGAAVGDAITTPAVPAKVGSPAPPAPAKTATVTITPLRDGGATVTTSALPAVPASKAEEAVPVPVHSTGGGPTVVRYKADYDFIGEQPWPADLPKETFITRENTTVPIPGRPGINFVIPFE